MKNLLLAIFLLSSFSSWAGPGDTTWAQAQNNTWMTYYGNFDTMAKFPDGSKSYQRIIMEWTVGKYVCPGTPQYCSDWDYDVNAYLLAANDTLEIARLITPYAKGPRMDADWKQRYYFDVTDYYTQLQDSALVRLNYRGYSGGFTSTVRFAFIEGTRSRDVVDVQRLWFGSKAYGQAVSIDSAVKSRTLTAPGGTQEAVMKYVITGHGADANYCSEFCSKWYEVKKDGNMIYHKDIWRDNCGVNQLYPQSGTWIYDRANWCPGDMVYPFYHPIGGVVPGVPYDLDIDFQPYTASASGPSYSMEAQMFYYKGYNKMLDLSMEKIIAPTNFEGNFRQNNICNQPIILVKNLGGSTVNNVKIEYGFPQNSTVYNHVATLSLAPQQEMEIILPQVSDLMSATGDSNRFFARIVSVNGGVDEEPSNNTAYSTFSAVPVLANKVRLELRTNNVVQNRWKLYDASNNVVAMRDGIAANTWYYDTLTLNKGCYKVILEDDGCDGLKWWANSAQGTGRFYIKQNNAAAITPLKGYAYGNTTYEGDFGCQFAFEFRVDSLLGISEVDKSGASINLVPNPANTTVNVQLNGLSNYAGIIHIYDAVGKLVSTTKTTKATSIIDVSGLANGVYVLAFSNEEIRSTQKLVIRR